MKKTKLLQVGITGGIASGKSTICKVFNQLGIPIYDADSRAKWVLNNDASLKNLITRAFGKEAYDSEGVYDRKYMASIVFNDSKNVALLNSIVHPKVAEDYKLWVVNSSSRSGYVVKEAALLFESDSYKTLDYIINVEAPEEVRIARVRKRDPFRSTEEIKGIIAKQWTDEERKRYADFIILNDDHHLVIPQVLLLHEKFKSLAVGG